MTREEIISDLRASAPWAFVERHIFDRVPHAFGGDLKSFVGWRRQLAEGLGVDPSDLTVVGSAAIGVSLSPVKNFKEFDDTSDLDVAVISQYHFQDAWRFFKRNGNLRAGMNYRERSAWDEHRTRLIFWGAIATDQLLSYMPFGVKWREAIDKVETASPLTNQINVRVYTDYDSLRRYQEQSVNKRRTDLLSGSG